MIDTLAISKRLQKAGDTPEHAEAVAEVFGMVFQENVVTKTDLRDACEKLDKKIDTVAASLDKKIDTVAASLDKKIDTVAASLDKKIDTVAARLDGKIVGLDGRILGLEQRGEALAARYESRLSRAVLTLFVGLTGVISLATSLLMTHVK
ncbi:MAG: hypothetical protein PXZ07_06510 [Candidatus Eremiobacteraeota bacterium]|nr:hypothetical protein [Candidatus Eremiobacteraeota bacterium]